jgi:hypothetical protein
MGSGESTGREEIRKYSKPKDKLIVPQVRHVNACELAANRERSLSFVEPLRMVRLQRPDQMNCTRLRFLELSYETFLKRKKGER